MKIARCFLLFRLAAVASIAAFSALAQTARPDFNRPQTFDAQHYVIRAGFDRVEKKVFGDTTISLKPLASGFRVVELDAVDLDFESVRLEPSNLDLNYRAEREKVIITLDKAYGPGDLISIRLKYTAGPRKGVYFVAAADDHSAQIWSQGEPDEARHWFPSFDFPSDKATTEEYLTVEKGETVIGNGEFLGKNENSDGTETWHYKMPVPHSTYLVSFVIGKYVRIDDKYKDLPLSFYVYPGKETAAKRAFGGTRDMIGIFERLTGVAYPYNKYDQTVVASFQFGGMENISATTMSDNEILFFGGAGVTDLVSHELAHSWFGNLVTCRNWAELWLNEGFATYMEAVYREEAIGRSSYMEKVRSDAAEYLIDDTIGRKRHGLFNLRAADVASLFDNPATTYDKGGVVIHMLREHVGTEAFWKGINIYLNRHKFGSVESTDLRAAMEEASARDLGWFFDQWVYGAGAPRLDIKQVYSPRARTLTVTVSQTQAEDAITPRIFRLPLDVVVRTASGRVDRPIEVTRRVQTFSFRVAAKPTSVLIDPAEKVPLKRLKMRPMVTSK